MSNKKNVLFSYPKNAVFKDADQIAFYSSKLATKL